MNIIDLRETILSDKQRVPNREQRNWAVPRRLREPLSRGTASLRDKTSLHAVCNDEIPQMQTAELVKTLSYRQFDRRKYCYTTAGSAYTGMSFNYQRWSKISPHYC